MTAVEYIFHYYCRRVVDGYDNDDNDDDDGDDDSDGDGAPPANKQESNTSPAHVSLSLSPACNTETL